MIIDKHYIDSTLRDAYEQGDPMFDDCTEYPFTAAELNAIAERVSSSISLNDALMEAILDCIDEAAFSALTDVAE